VISRTATTLSVPRRGVAEQSRRMPRPRPTAAAIQAAAGSPFSLQAASFAAAGDATVTVRASAGGRTQTVALPIAVVDALPAG
jgi:hypothetical protein